MAGTQISVFAEVAADVEPGGTVTVPYPELMEQTDFIEDATVPITVYSKRWEAAAVFGASDVTLTWPADAPYDLPAGEHAVSLRTCCVPERVEAPEPPPEG